MSHLGNWLWNGLRALPDLLYVPKCAFCATRMPPGSKTPLCPICRTRYEDEKEATCPACGGRMSDCLCTPPDLPSCGVHRMVKLFRYLPASDEVSAQMIYHLKHKNLITLQRFLADELAKPLSGLVEQPEEWVITYPPRSVSAKRRDGFDHAAALAKALAKGLGCAYLPTLVREGHAGIEQKRLSRTARLTAAKENYTVRQGLFLGGKRVVLVDDVMTTGATLVASARLLRKAGAKEVVFAVLALTPSKKSYRE
ncbi:MAG: ComF family protein [Clostridia bacterium]|nr:ComF family protein [Clostridia bacterium]